MAAYYFMIVLISLSIAFALFVWLASGSGSANKYSQREDVCEICGGEGGWTTVGGYGNNPKEVWVDCPHCNS